MEKIAFELLPLDYKLVSNEFREHPTLSEYWAGTPDLIIEGELIAAEFLVGDPVYYSPEFAKHIATAGKTPAPNKKSDIFSEIKPKMILLKV